MGRKLLFLSIAILFAFALLSCDEEIANVESEGELTPSRSADAAGDRSVPAPFNARRLSGAELASVIERETGEGFLDDPTPVYRQKTYFLYNFMSGDNIYAQAGFNFAGDETNGYTVKCSWSIPNEKTGQLEVALKISYTLDTDLRPVFYNRRTPITAEGGVDLRNVDFTADKFGLRTATGEGELTEEFIEIERPEGELWLYSDDEFLDMGLILQCIDPDAESIELWTLDVKGERINRIALEKGDVEKISLSEVEKPIMATRYTASMEGIVVGNYFVDRNGRLIYGEFVGGVKVELVDPDGKYVY